ncbi:MAG TPA: ribose 5-phosphate isomerase B [Anaerolineaceae bacterium]|nr:ribose 5-phosphate isomerase B [Anaerolineaceae bacterium]
MKIAIASDHAGFLLKEQIKNYLDSRLIEYEDFGTHNEESTDYPRYAELVAKAIQSHGFDLGILVCGTGIGMSIAANKFHGIRAAVCSEPFSAILSRRHNNSNVLCMGSRVVGSGLAMLITEGWLNAAYEGGRHERRVGMITRMEQRNAADVLQINSTDDTQPFTKGE